MTKVNAETATLFMGDVQQEFERAVQLWPPMGNAHEAFAVILEELEEFKVHVFTNQKKRDSGKMYRELVQVAAMCLRAAHDGVCRNS